MTISFDPLSARDAATKEWSGRAESAGDAMVKAMKSAREWAEETVSEDGWLLGHDDAHAVVLADSTDCGIEDAKYNIERLASRIQADARAPLEKLLREAHRQLAIELDTTSGPRVPRIIDLMTRIEESLR